MLKAVIIDDEYIVIEGIKAIVDWESMGVELAGFAYDGIEGLKMLKTHCPDIVITDIRIPGMDGLALIDNAKDFLPDSVFIVMSGYSEFEYAKSAVSLGVIEYIDKPVTVEKVEEVLQKAKKMIQFRRDHGEMRNKLFGAQRAVIERLIYDIVSGERIEEQKLFELQSFYDIDLMGIQRAICSIGRFEEDSSGSCEEFRCMCEYMQETFNQDGYACFIMKQGKEFILTVFSFSSFSAGEEMNARLLQAKRKCEEQEIHFSLGVGRAYPYIYNLSNSYLEAKKALRYALFMEENGIFFVDKVEYKDSVPVFLGLSKDSIVFSIRSADKPEVIRQVGEFLQALRNYNLSPDFFCHECLKLLYLGLKVAGETGREFRMEDDVEFLPHKDILKYRTFDAISRWMISTFERMMDWIQDIRRSSNHKSIILIKDFLNQNFSKEITLNELADKVNMNPTYLSILFKDEIGMTYVKYLAKIRIENARKLLDEGYKVGEVSTRVGYYNYRHFCDVFKKNMGITPNEYKGNSKERK